MMQDSRACQTIYTVYEKGLTILSDHYLTKLEGQQEKQVVKQTENKNNCKWNYNQRERNPNKRP